MKEIKSYTDLPQSKKLAEFLPLESADMCFAGSKHNAINTPYLESKESLLANFCKADFMSPCWSLASLLATLPNVIITDSRFYMCHYQIDICKYDGGDNTTLYQIAYGNNRGSSGSWRVMVNTGEKENLIDCCVQMILKLHELELL